jgi:hypothetical protein
MSAYGGLCAAAAVAAAILLGLPAEPRAQQNPVAAVEIDADDIGGVVTSRFGPEAGVWIIAQTTDLGTRFAKIAVTDERGRYVVPDLPRHITRSGCADTGSSTRRKSMRSRASAST